MTGINKITPSRAVRPVKPNNKNKPDAQTNKKIEKQRPKDTEDDSVPKHIDERV
ncbi:MAG: hypothetical protein ACJA2Y_001500 [Cycloclasticus pugetii]|jgi:hypothetical protein|uniref:Uncharacterized protein n=1 Tax=Cycloclasticus zancles 78-ME TaxID=1198232 RepID=S5T6X5_9GAMM|nr:MULTISPECIES: hypothetical protein [Cycloclasticus]AGS39264.1 hypothetical protein CYCME_0931 [Cycloclasticus zancles 78-ME]MBV1898916.1 hypothetical protein [Cycloclasticus sp.]MDF1828485.1 hypothetical protein [Cycloclasticus pugetii]